MGLGVAWTHAPQGAPALEGPERPPWGSVQQRLLQQAEQAPWAGRLCTSTHVCPSASEHTHRSSTCSGLLKA